MATHGCEPSDTHGGANVRGAAPATNICPLGSPKHSSAALGKSRSLWCRLCACPPLRLGSGQGQSLCAWNARRMEHPVFLWRGEKDGAFWRMEKRQRGVGRSSRRQAHGADGWVPRSRKSRDAGAPSVGRRWRKAMESLDLILLRHPGYRAKNAREPGAPSIR